MMTNEPGITGITPSNVSQLGDQINISESEFSQKQKVQELDNCLNERIQKDISTPQTPTENLTHAQGNQLLYNINSGDSTQPTQSTKSIYSFYNLCRAIYKACARLPLPSEAHAKKALDQVFSKGKNSHLGELKKIDIFNKVNILEVAKNMDDIEKEFESKVKNLKSPAKEIVENRMKELREMVKFADTLEADKFKPDIINKLVNYRLEIKKQGITDAFPSELIYTENEDGIILDKEQKKFDNLREPESPKDRNGSSAAERFQKFCAKKGGNSQIIIKWYNAQNAGTNSKTGLFIQNKIKGFRNVEPDKIWEPISLEGTSNKLRFSLNVEDTVLMFMAFNMELLSKTNIPGKNPENGTIKLYRTENKTVLESNKITKAGTNETYTMNRQFLASTSIIKAGAYLSGHEVTEQDVPLHRIVGTYLTHKLAFGYEMEFIAMLDDIPFKYTKSLPPPKRT